MTDRDLNVEAEQGCPKRLWVMLTLSDDELVDGGGELPRGLSFHLSRCDSCRAVADRLRVTTDRLAGLGRLEPSGELFAAATARAVDALHDGARLTGRVDIPDEPPAIEEQERGPGRMSWAPRLAAAAVIAFAVTVWGVVAMRGGFTAHRGEGSYVKGGVVPGVSIDRPAPAQMGAPGSPEQPAGDDVASLAAAKSEDEGGEQPAARPAGHARIVRHQTHMQAATANEMEGPESIIVLPDTRARNLGWGHLFDRQAPDRSTTPSREDR